MATDTQKGTEDVNMNINLTEMNKSTESTITKEEVTEEDERKEGEDTGEKTGQSKKRYRSEKQKERTRQYKKKIRIAKKQLMREKKLAEMNINDGDITGGIWSPNPKVLETGSPTSENLPQKRDKVEPGCTGADKNPLKDTLTEPDYTQSRSTPSEELVQLECPGEEKSPSGEKLTDTLHIQLGSDNHDESSTTNLLMEVPIGEDELAENEDIFGILSVYVESSIHFEFEKDFGDITNSDSAYLYFSMSDFLNIK